MSPSKLLPLHKGWFKVNPPQEKGQPRKGGHGWGVEKGRGMEGFGFRNPEERLRGSFMTLPVSGSVYCGAVLPVGFKHQIAH